MNDKRSRKNDLNFFSYFDNIFITLEIFYIHLNIFLFSPQSIEDQCWTMRASEEEAKAKKIDDGKPCMLTSVLLSNNLMRINSLKCVPLHTGLSFFHVWAVGYSVKYWQSLGNSNAMLLHVPLQLNINSAITHEAESQRSTHNRHMHTESGKSERKCSEWATTKIMAKIIVQQQQRILYIKVRISLSPHCYINPFRKLCNDICNKFIL